MEVTQRHPDHHDEHRGRAVQPDLCAVHHHLHLRRDGHAAVREGLRGARVSVGRVCNAKMEFHRFHAQV